MNEENIQQTAPVEMTAGEMLRNARTTGRRKRELSTIAKQLCIREDFLQALEDGNYSFIPELVYILGFARNYAMELGLNPDEIVNKIKCEMGVIRPDSSSDAAEDLADAPTCAMPSIPKEPSLFVQAYKFVLKHWKWFTIGLGAIVLSILLIWGVVSLVSGGAVEQPVETPVATISEPEFSVKVRERFGTENRQKAQVILQAAHESWVKIEDGRGNTVFSRVLVPGDVYYMPVGENYKGTFGNAGGIDVWVNGKKAAKLGDSHERKDKVPLAPSKLMPATDKKAE